MCLCYKYFNRSSFEKKNGNKYCVNISQRVEAVIGGYHDITLTHFLRESENVYIQKALRMHTSFIILFYFILLY